MPQFDHRRRTWLVSRKQQLPFIALLLANTVILLGVAIVFGALACLSVRSLLPLLPAQYAGDLWSATWFFVIRGAIILLLVATWQVLWALRASVRLAGPMHRFLNLMQEVAQGNLTQRVNFRRGDTLRELTEPLNRRVGEVDAQFGRIQSQVPFLWSAIQDLRAAAEQGGPKPGHPALKELQGRVESLVEACDEMATVETGEGR